MDDILRREGKLRDGEVCIDFTEGPIGGRLESLTILRCSKCGKPGTPSGTGNGAMVHHAHRYGNILQVIHACAGGAMDTAIPSNDALSQHLHRISASIATAALEAVNDPSKIASLLHIINDLLSDPNKEAIRQGVITQALIIIPLILQGRYDFDHPPIFFAQEI